MSNWFYLYHNEITHHPWNLDSKGKSIQPKSNKHFKEFLFPEENEKDFKDAQEKYKDKKHHHHHDVNRHNENIRAFSMMSENPVNMIAFSFFRDKSRLRNT